jgi:glycosyltransferase involved in cell wall biosynthesis
MSAAPRVSVVAAVYNCLPYIGETIESVLQQTFPDWEFVVVDDCSTDGTHAALQEYAAVDPRVRVIRTDRNRRQTVCLNHAISQSRGDYLARIDGDDVMTKERLSEQVRFLDEHPDVALVGSHVERMDERGRFICIYRMHVSDAELRRDLQAFDPFYHPAVMIRRTALFAAGLYNPRFVYAQDYDLWIRVAGQGRIANLPLVLTRYRVLETGISRASARGQAREIFLIMVDALLKGLHPWHTAWRLWKPLLHMVSPSWLVRWRTRARDRRDRRAGEYALGGR